MKCARGWIKTQNKIVPEIRLKFAMFSLYLCNNLNCPDLGFQHLPRDPANVNARKNMFDPIFILPAFVHQTCCFSFLPKFWGHV